MTGQERRTRGFLFADLRGYTAFVESHGDDAAAGLISEYRRMVRRVVAEYRGAEIKTEGDSFYVVFESASSAVECGLELVDAATEWSRLEPERPIRVGVGIHAGDTVEVDDGYVGSAVNIAARVCSVAKPGEVAVSETVRGLIRTSLPVHFIPRGSPRLKGIATPLPLFAVKRGPAPSSPAWRQLASRPGGHGTGLLVAAVVVALLGGLGGVVLFAGGPTSSTVPRRETQSLRASASSEGVGVTAPSLATIGVPTDQIAHFVLNPDAGGYVALTRLDGTSHIRLTKGLGFEPSWSPDGSTIAFVQNVRSAGGQEFPQVWLVGSDGTNSRQITTVAMGAAQPAWSPDGMTLGIVLAEYANKEQQPVVTRSVIGVLDISTGSITVLGEDPAYRDSRPTWSPDGARLAFQRELPSGPGQQLFADIWTIEADGTDAMRVITGGDGSWAGEPAWSPDGQLLAFTMSGDIYVANLEGTALRRLTEHPGEDSLPSWSRDGAAIAFQSFRDFHYEIYLMDSNGGRQTRLTHNPEGGGAYDPDWGPPTSAEPP